MGVLLIVQILFQWLIVVDDCVVTSVIVIFSCQEVGLGKLFEKVRFLKMRF
jgi:hypothetical protein